MVIVHARVGERLIYGQVAMVWTNTVGATRIIMINDEAVKDKTIIAGLKIAKPAGVRLSILSKKRAMEKFAGKTHEDDKVFLITRNVDDMAELVKAGLPIPAVSVGNIAKWEGSRPVKKSVNLAEQDITDVEGLIESGISITAQMIPNESGQITLNYL